MKHLFYGLTLGIISILCILLVVSLEGQTTRRNEIENSLKTAVNEAISDTYENGSYTIDDNEEFIADFTQTLINNINVGDTNEDGVLSEDEKYDKKFKLKVDVLGIDSDKGLLSIRVTEKYSALSGKVKEAKYETTAVFDKPNEKEVYSAVFVLGSGEVFSEQMATQDNDITQQISEVTPPKYEYTYSLAGETKYVYSDEANVNNVIELSSIAKTKITKKEFKYWMNEEDGSAIIFPYELTKSMSAKALYQ